MLVRQFGRELRHKGSVKNKQVKMGFSTSLSSLAIVIPKKTNLTRLLTKKRGKLYVLSSSSFSEWGWW